MKTLQQFQCEICNTVYKSKSECEICEKTHSKPINIVGAKFHAYKSCGEYPTVIDIEMSDGTIQKYKR